MIRISTENGYREGTYMSIGHGYRQISDMDRRGPQPPKG